MDINEYLNKLSEEDKMYADYCRDNPNRKVVYDSFIAGYKAATTWYPMEEAPKDGSHLLIIDEDKYIHHAYWFKIGPYDNQDFDWCIDQAYSVEIDEYKVVKSPIAWTYLPVYKP